ncbi:HEAT repeat domain-containing protein [Streptomyces sp. HNM0574]|uniref:HEAT repeat domain-containing protein n=1 Tax=Streptomyces sp. HNM0574 TaxID=2714954 RepID=UPI00146D47F9|nr:HEAT repeat domain-containing protein [Streptomyces sp. HNM0574]NLU66644.1 HEAT repeat domain-containing protein [Streptomyces sp. HNM0574]
MDEWAGVRELLGTGYIGAEQARAVRERAPGFAARILEHLGAARDSGDWSRFLRLANLAAWLRPAGLGELLVAVLAERPPGLDVEDLVEILGELETPQAVPVLAQLLREWPRDPYRWLSLKCVRSLGAIGGERARRALREMAEGDGPDPLRWNAAVELGIEDELGFDEEEMDVCP